MSDNAPERPLTRRERRELEMQQLAHDAEATAAAEQAAAEAAAEAEATAEEAPEIEIDESLIEVPTVDAEGNQLTRREMRELREEMIEALRAEKLAEQAAEEEPEPEAQPESIEDDDSQKADVDEADDVAVDEPEVQSESYDVPTEALTLEDLQEIAADTKTADESAADHEQPLEYDAEAVEESQTVDEGEEASSSEVTADEEGYTFPDIKPLEMDRPIFDDPSQRQIANAPMAGQGTGFEDMIERAVADENASVHSGTSSLILPTLPGSDDLSGSIGSTGELFVTGSIELPKSIGETGGHAKLQESVDAGEAQDADALEMLNLTDMYETSEFDSAPVSASHAVSARSIEKTGITAPEVKHNNKKSLVYMSIGGGLILVLIAGGLWAAQSGLFG